MIADRFFIDTNILIYAVDRATVSKHMVARHWMRETSRKGTGVLSTQVIGEFFHVAVIRKKLLSVEEAEVTIHDLATFPTELVDITLVHAAIALHRRFGSSYWDSLILAAAKRAGCNVVLSEDFNSGQDYDGVRAQNPFL